LTDHIFPRPPNKAIWDIEGNYCSSRHILSGVKFAGCIHPGQLLDMWNKREAAPVAEESTRRKIHSAAVLPRLKSLIFQRSSKGAMAWQKLKKAME
jgi:hypothetical protein